MTDRWSALERLAAESGERADPEELARLCALAGEVAGACGGEIVLREGKKWSRAAGAGENALSAERRAELCERALESGAWRGAEEMAFLMRDRGEALGVWIARRGGGDPEFGEEDFAAGRAAAAALSGRIREARAKGLLASRFAAAALAGAGASAEEASRMISGDPELAAKVLAKGFCAEMARCGLGPKHALAAGIEVIGQASSRLGDRRGKGREIGPRGRAGGG